MALELTDSAGRRRRSWRLSPEWLGVVAMLVLGPLAAVLVLWLIPSAFDIESNCVTSLGMTRTPGDQYLSAFAVLGTLGWFAVLVGAVYAGIADARRLAAALPVAWFAVLVGAALVTAAAIGPAVCPV